MSGHKPVIFLDTKSTVSCSFTVPHLTIWFLLDWISSVWIS
jgi:hypothetical protein